MPSHTFKMEYLRSIHGRYHKASRKEKSRVLDEFCRTAHIHRKHAIRLLAGPRPDRSSVRTLKPRGRLLRYGAHALSFLREIWTAAGYPCGQRLKALLPHWLPWAHRRWSIDDGTARQMLDISSRQIDRRLAVQKLSLKKRLYGTTKPGAILKHMIPLRTDFWNVHRPGYTEADLVAHSGPNAAGDFIQTLDVTDILSTWTERQALMGKSEAAVVDGARHIETRLPFPWLGLDCDNGSEFINHHLWAFCRQRPRHHQIQFTRSRPYKKDDNAHIEQKNRTHVRQRIGYDRFDSQKALDLMNDIYDDLRLLDNLFLPSQKLAKKIRKGSRLIRRYDKPRTAFDRVKECPDALPDKIRELDAIRRSTDPFELSERVERKLQKLQTLASRHKAGRHIRSAPRPPRPFSRKSKQRDTLMRQCNDRWLSKITRKGALAR